MDPSKLSSLTCFSKNAQLWHQWLGMSWPGSRQSLEKKRVMLIEFCIIMWMEWFEFIVNCFSIELVLDRKCSEVFTFILDQHTHLYSLKVERSLIRAAQSYPQSAVQTYTGDQNQTSVNVIRPHTYTYKDDLFALKRSSLKRLKRSFKAPHQLHKWEYLKVPRAECSLAIALVYRSHVFAF